MPFNTDGTWDDTRNDEGRQGKYTADAVIAEQNGEGTLDAERATQAETAGVSRAAYIAYADVINNYALRSDVEPLADRRARHQGEALTDADFTRDANYTGDNYGAVVGGAGHTSRAGETKGATTVDDLDLPAEDETGDGEGEGGGEG